MSSPLADRLSHLLIDLGPVEAKRFFSGIGLSLEGRQFAFLLRETLYLRVDDDSRPAIAEAGGQPFSYRTRVRQVTVASYYSVPPEVLADSDRLRNWAARAYAAARKVKRRARRKND